MTRHDGVWLPNTEAHPLSILDHGPRLETRGIVLHATESGSLDGTVRYFADGSGGGDNRGVGAHLVIDNTKAVQLIRLDHKAWHAVEANGFAIGIEQVGFAEWERHEWLGRSNQLRLVANRIAWICHEWNLGIPHRHHNVWGHADGGRAWGGHVDPGHGYPWDTVIRHAQHSYAHHWGRT